MNDELYWERVCREVSQPTIIRYIMVEQIPSYLLCLGVLQHKGWEHCDIADHGLSWKQLFFERYIAESIENFGIHRGVSREFENSFLRYACLPRRTYS